jgi:hypothetical protein
MPIPDLTMKKTKKISYLYFATGLILCLYSFVSQNKQILNIDDTYYVISGNDFAIFISLIYLVLGAIFLVIEKYLSLRIKVIQYLMFNIPFIYFIFSDISEYNNPGYYLGNPIAYKWNTVYIPVGLIFCFLTSIILFISLFVFAFWKWKKRPAANS